MSQRSAVLFLFVHVGNWEGAHAGAWRMPDAPPSPALDFERIKQLVQKAEQGKFHGIFLSDILALPDNYSQEALSHTVEAEGLEPFTLTSALAACTSKIGLALTANTTYNEPYHVARKFASLDHISGGRSAWNVVAGGNHTEARNFSRAEQVDHSSRYARAEEFFDVVTGLWDGWEGDAFLRDKESGVYFDIDRLHPLDHKGEHFSVAGPVTVPRPVQGHPVIAQAGSSPQGMEFAAKIGELIFCHQHDIEKAREYYTEVKGMVAASGRDPEHAMILPSLIVLVGRTQEEADETLAQLDSLGDVEVGLKRLAFLINYDLSDHPLDGPVPEIPVTNVSSQGLQSLYVELARKNNLTVRQLAQLALRGRTIAGPPEVIADYIEEWVTSRACDGFNLSVAESGSLDLFVDQVVPELQRRGVFHEDYRGNTLREYLGLPQPVNRYTKVDDASSAG